ncbi:MAG TPA: acetate--CoA ligase family protein [Beijerinckiaceae bacterium]|nr:acetate--CoA ligase family protein [Beijerinckiaceae bacterium]
MTSFNPKTDGVARLMNPKSVAIVGMSSKPGAAGHVILQNLTLNDFAGEIYLVGRSGGSIDGRPVLSSVDDLPVGVDLAVFTLPAAGVHEAMAACVRRRVGAAVVYASGFAETGERATQEALGALAQEGGVALLGPNCLGFTNAVDRVRVSFASALGVPRINVERDPPVAIISQSGGLLSHIRFALEARDLPVSYAVSTGNEAGLGLAEFIDFLTADDYTRVIILYVEQVRRPADFLRAAERARAAGKPVLMMHPGRTERARSAVSSHSGSLAGNHDIMRTLVAHAGILFIDTLDELVDAAEILARYPIPPVKGPGIITFSGAFCAIAYDFCEELGLDVPPLSPDCEARLASELPAFVSPQNPLDLTTQPLYQPDLMASAPKALLEDPELGSLLLSIPISSPKYGMLYLRGLLAAMERNAKPVVLSVLNDRAPLPADFVALAREQRVILSRSADRGLRALACVTFHGRSLARARSTVAARPFAELPKLGQGPQAEWLGKRLLAAIGIAVPDGTLARTAQEATEIARNVGYPVALKAQAGALVHKTEAGGVVLGIADETALQRAWDELASRIRLHRPDLQLDGVLVEAMAPKGLEMIVAARRDPQWGLFLLVGLGGIWVEAFDDVRLLPPDLDETSIVAELWELRAARVLDGFRGSPAADVEAVAHAVSLLGRLMLTEPSLEEVEINPLVVHPKGGGVTALDAFVVTSTFTEKQGS